MGPPPRPDECIWPIQRKTGCPAFASPRSGCSRSGCQPRSGEPTRTSFLTGETRQNSCGTRQSHRHKCRPAAIASDLPRTCRHRPPRRTVSAAHRVVGMLDWFSLSKPALGQVQPSAWPSGIKIEPKPRFCHLTLPLNLGQLPTAFYAIQYGQPTRTYREN